MTNTASTEGSLREEFNGIIQDTLASKDGDGTWWGYDTTVDVDNAFEMIEHLFHRYAATMAREELKWVLTKHEHISRQLEWQINDRIAALASPDGEIKGKA